jgi:hypothetical protein
MRRLGLSGLAFSLALSACAYDSSTIPDPATRSTEERDREPSRAREFIAPPTAAPPAEEPKTEAPRPKTLARIDGLLDFDFDETHLVALTEGHLVTCALPTCASRIDLGVAATSGSFTVARGRVYFADESNASLHAFTSVRLDGTDARRLADAPPFTASFELISLHAGSRVEGLALRKPVVDLGRYEYQWIGATSDVRNDARAGRVTPHLHTDVDGRVVHVPSQRPAFGQEVRWSFSVDGAEVVEPVAEPDEVGISPIAGARYPAVVVRRGTRLEACPIDRTTRRCETWLDLGDQRGTFALDDAKLYLGNDDGLFRCPLVELAARGTCTFERLTSEPVNAPLYVTREALVWRGLGEVRSLAK